MDRRGGGLWHALSHWPLLLASVVCLTIGGILVRDVPNGNLVTAFILVVLGLLLMGAFLAAYLGALSAGGPERHQDPPDDPPSPSDDGPN